MISQNEVYLSVETRKGRAPFRISAESKISEMEHSAVRRHNLVPVPDKCLVHLFDVIERAIAVPDDVWVVEMRV